jgi:Fic family protein
MSQPMPRRLTGTYEPTTVAGEPVDAFLPFPLPPSAPPLDLSAHLHDALTTADRALARLDVASALVTSLDWFLYAFVRKEAVLSSQIEGTQASLVDLLSFEASADELPGADVEEVCNYVDALTWARAQLHDPSAPPLSMRLLNGAHARLMAGVRGADKRPGEVRRSQNWIGGSRPSLATHVPPPPHLLQDLLGAFERSLHDDMGLPPLVRAGLLHVQFETLHPYLDGNGRLGRLLIALYLEQEGLLRAPLLYLSAFFMTHRAEYYRRLNEVRTEGDWEGWLLYFLDGVATTADEAVASAHDLWAVVTQDREVLLTSSETTVPALRLFELLPKHPVLTVATVVRLLQTSKPTAARAVESLRKAGVLVETTGRQRDRWFAYERYLDRLKVGTELGKRRQS